MAEPSVPLDVIGQLIAGRYVVEEVLGQGGMAAVYRVLDAKTGRRCALKRSWAREAAGLPKRRALLEREYYTLAQLAHPRIIEVYDFGVDEADPYYTMELLEGGDLDGLGRVGWREAAALLRDVASSLAILHSRGLLHRDLSARNVRRDGEGRAKLIDFGALCSIGVSRDVIGTPPFVPPESLQSQALDSRADLYALGALGYLLLTGRHAYPARRLYELRDIWRSSPQAIERLAPEVPPALRTLIMQLLALDRGARPQSAAEIMKRLCAIAGLTLDEDIAVSRAYLTMPTIVGRDAALVTTRKLMLGLARGDGGTLLIEGVAGSGRSRMLDACGLEGKLTGALVARAGGGSEVAEDWAVARKLCERLAEHLPEETLQVGNLSRDVLGHLIPALRAQEPAALPERSVLMRELREYVLNLSVCARLILLVDDVDRIDEPSLAWLTSLAHKLHRRPVLLALAVDKESASAKGTSLQLLRSIAHSVELGPLDGSQTESLMRSLFGGVPNLPLVAARIHALSHGNARATMELAQHVVQRGLARYVGGAWSLPPDLTERELPNTLDASLEARLTALPADARELCDVACVAESYAISSPHLSELTHDWAHDRLFKALHELTSSRVLVVEAEHYRFSHHGFSAVIRDSMPQARRRALHSRMADVLTAVGGSALRRAHHLLEAGRDLDAIAELTGMDLRNRHAPGSLLRRALERAEQHRLPVRTLADLRLGLAMAELYSLEVESFRRVAQPCLELLTHDAGLTRYRELHALPPEERLQQALTQAQAAHLAAAEHERGYSVAEAIPRLARLANAYAVIAIWSIDREIVEALPSLEPLSPLSPAIGVTIGLVEAAQHWVSGRFLQATQLYSAALERLSQPDGAGLDPTQLNLLRMNCHLLLGTARATVGIASAEENAQALEQYRTFRGNCWRIRQLYSFSQGDLEEAQRCARRAALLSLQEGLEQQAAGGAQPVEVLAYAKSQDLIGLGHALEAFAELVAKLPSIRSLQCYGSAVFAELHGDLPGALAQLTIGLPLAPAGRHWMFLPLSAAHIRLLSALGRNDEAIERAQAYLSLAESERLTDCHGIRSAYAVALAQAGSSSAGMRMVEALIAEYLELGISGMALGDAYESAARIALGMSDKARFDRFAELCAAEYLKGTSPMLRIKLARLIAQAHPKAPGPGERDLLALETEAPVTSAHDSLYSRMRECTDGSDRARCALSMVLKDAQRNGGALYAIEGRDLQLMASMPEPTEPGLSDFIRDWLLLECSQDSGAAVTTESAVGPDPIDERAPRYFATDGSSFEPIALWVDQPLGRRVVAVLALQLEAGPRAMPSRQLLDEIAGVLLEYRDTLGVMAQDYGSLSVPGAHG